MYAETDSDTIIHYFNFKLDEIGKKEILTGFVGFNPNVSVLPVNAPWVKPRAGFRQLQKTGGGQSKFLLQLCVICQMARIRPCGALSENYPVITRPISSNHH